MNIQITDKLYAVRAQGVQCAAFHLVEDRNPICGVFEHSIAFEALSVVELYQQHYEVLKCLRRTMVRTTYVMLLEERNKLEARIDQLLATRN